MRRASRRAHPWPAVDGAVACAPGRRLTHPDPPANSPLPPGEHLGCRLTPRRRSVAPQCHCRPWHPRSGTRCRPARTTAAGRRPGPQTPRSGTVLLDDVTLSNAGLRTGGDRQPGHCLRSAIGDAGSTLSLPVGAAGHAAAGPTGKVMTVGDAVSLLPGRSRPRHIHVGCQPRMAVAVGISWTRS